MMNKTSLLRRPLAGLASLALIGAAPIAATIALPAPAYAAGGTLDNAVAALRGISTMRADFTQTDRSGQTVRGKMTLKRPGKIRFEYADDVPLLIVSNGKSLTMIDYEVNQVQRWPISNSPLGALLDPRTGHQFAMSVTTPPLPQVRRSAGCCTRAEIAISRPTSCALSKHIGICRRGGSGVRATGCAGNVFRTSIHRITNRTVASATSLISCSVGLDAESAS